MSKDAVELSKNCLQTVRASEISSIPRRKGCPSAFCAFLFGLLQLGAVIYGTCLRILFQNGEECEMSWSSYKFVPVHLNSHKHRSNPAGRPSHHLPHLSLETFADFDPQYRVYKFVDGRDPRYGHYFNSHSSLKSLRGARACPAGTSASQHLVLFVPGYGGAYQQARSLGAHGIQLAKETIPLAEQQSILDGLAHGHIHSAAQDIPNFLFDVYAVEFKSHFLFHSFPYYTQAQYLAHVIYHFPELCPHLKDITIVAHSMGGLVARRAMILTEQHFSQSEIHDGQPKRVRLNLITLATPHKLMPFLFESSMYHFYHQLRQDEMKFASSYTTDPSVRLSISGGLQDELIPPELCFWNQPVTTMTDNKPITLFASQIVTSSTDNNVCREVHGMDHKAIVWCWNLLHSIRSFIHAMIVRPPHHNSSSLNINTSRSRILQLVMELESNRSLCYSNEPHPSDSRDLEDPWSILYLHRQRLATTFGYLSSILLESTMLYNIQLLVLLYALNANLFLFIMHLYTVLNPRSWMRMEALIALIYFMGPLFVALATSLFLSRCLSSIIYFPSSIIYFILPSYVAMSLYFILYGICWKLGAFFSPFYVSAPKSITLNRFPREPRVKSNIYDFVRRTQLIQHIPIRKDVFVFLALIILFTHMFSGSSRTLSFNFTAFQSFIFLGTNLSVLQNVMMVGFHPDWVEPCVIKNHSKLTMNSRRLGTMVMLLPLFMIVFMGKMYLAFCLLSLEGQKDAQYYLLQKADVLPTSHSGHPRWWSLFPFSAHDDYIHFFGWATFPLFLYLRKERQFLVSRD